MSDQLLPLYDQELAYLRTLAGEFADAHPKIAGRLRLSADAVDDPHVARLIEGFALIAARIRQKLDDEFPEITDSLLGALYPHMLAPFPSASIARFSPLEDLDGAYRIARATPLEMEPIAGEACRYRTTQDVELWPIAVRSAELGGRPLVAPAGPHTEAAVSSLRLVLECLSPGQSFTALGMDRLRFYLHGLPQHAAGLYELLCNNLRRRGIRRPPRRPPRGVRRQARHHPRRLHPRRRPAAVFRRARSPATGCSANISPSRRNSFSWTSPASPRKPCCTPAAASRSSSISTARCPAWTAR